MARPARALLDMGALRHNAAIARRLAGEARVMGVVKANAYGHGAVAMARALEPAVDALAVACLEEAGELRDAGVKSPILLLEGVFEPAELALAARHDLWITVCDERQLAWLEEARLPGALACWLKVNTGMNRLGVSVHTAQDLYARLAACDHCAGPPVIYTHLSSAEIAPSDATPRQLERFDDLCPGAPRSAANSAGLLAWPTARYDWVRPGYMLYGNSPLPAAHPAADDLQPVMTLTSAVIALRDVAPGGAVGYGGTWVARRPSRIATVAIGYGDGYPRQSANGTPVLVNGQRAALAGRVSMDMITVEVTGLDGVELGSEVVLWGPGLPVDEVARWSGSVGYELLTRMPARTPRVCLADGSAGPSA